MKGMFWKEWREMLPSVMVALAVFALVDFAVVRSGGTFATLIGDWPSSALVAWNCIGSIVYAGLLGFFQIQKEQRRDQWAFVLHRPATRTALYLGKVWAGLSAYVMPIILPLSACSVWFAIPGHIPEPFHLVELLPAMTCLVVGCGFYFAGQLSALRTAPWYESKALGLASVLFVNLTAATAGNPELIILVASFVAALALAAWGAFVSQDDYDSQLRMAKVAAAGVNYVGAFSVVLFLLSVPLGLVHSSDDVLPHYELDQNGNVGLLSAGHFAKVTAVDATTGQTSTGPQPPNLSSFTDPPRVGATVMSLYDTDLHWSMDGTLGLMVGYSWRTKRPVVSMTPDGAMSIGQALNHRFPADVAITPSVDSKGFTLTEALVSGRDIWLVDTGRMAMNHISVSGRGARFSTINVIDAAGNNDVGLAILSGKTLSVVDRNGKTLRSVELPADTAQNLQIASDTNAELYLLKNGSAGDGPAWVMTVSLPAGQAKLTRLKAIPPYPPQMWGGIRAACGMPSVVAIAVQAYRVVVPVDRAQLFAGYDYYVNTYWFWIPNINMLVGLVSALIALAIGRRCGFGLRRWWPWAVGAFLFGPAFVIMLLSLRSWPTRELCPTCGRKRVVERDTCEHCGAGWPPPAKDGREIFDDVEEKSVAVA